MGNIHNVRYVHLNNKEEDHWKSLAFGRRGTYNPASREKGCGYLAFPRIILFFCEALPGSPAFQSRMSGRNGPDGMQLLLSVKEHVSQKSYFPTIQGAILMKKILLTVVLGVAVSAVGQTAQPAPGQPATPPAQGQAAAAPAPQSAAPVIKDPAEYNAYVSAVDPAKDANAKISGLEAFLTQYPNSVMKNQALEILMGTYQQAGNPKKTMDTATKLVTADKCNVRALALLSYFDRVMAQGGDPNATQLLTDG